MKNSQSNKAGLFFLIVFCIICFGGFCYVSYVNISTPIKSPVDSTRLAQRLDSIKKDTLANFNFDQHLDSLNLLMMQNKNILLYIREKYRNKYDSLGHIFEDSLPPRALPKSHKKDKDF